MMEWQQEPDAAEWTTKAGPPGYILRNPSLGHLCGYVGFPADHPWHGRDYDGAEPYPDVHGGLTYAADHAPKLPPDGNWWLGFDCAHYGDLIPNMGRSGLTEDAYRNMAYVRRECENLAAQGMAAATAGETHGGSTEGNSPVGSADAPQQPPETNHD